MSKIIRTQFHNRVEYRLDDKLHRDDGPAVEFSYGSKFWYQEGKLHRLDGPAVEWGNGDKSWYQEDKLHRLDGPAIELANGEKYWYVKGKKYSEEEFNLVKLSSTNQEAD